jgi:hypothetical protein
MRFVPATMDHPTGKGMPDEEPLVVDHHVLHDVESQFE